MSQTTDRRVAKTKRALHAALDELLEEVPYAKISVQDILDRADVGRATFYTHYGNKDDLLAGSCFTTQIGRAFGERSDRSHDLPDFHQLFEHFAGRHRHYEAVFGSKGWQFVWDTARRDLYANWLDWAQRQTQLTIPATLVAHFLTGGVLSLMQGWLEEGEPVSADAVTDLLSELLILPNPEPGGSPTAD